MDRATQLAISTVVAALHFRGKIDDFDVSEITKGLLRVAEGAPMHIKEPLEELAEQIAGDAG